MIQLQPATLADVPEFVAMERATDTRNFVMPYSSATHQQNLSDPNLVYLKIVENTACAGFLILALDADGKSVEFRRIVIAAKGRGVGQTAMAHMETFCREHLGRQRIWLDVFEHNLRGRHIYEKIGYQKYGDVAHDRGQLWLYEKHLANLA